MNSIDRTTVSAVGRSANGSTPPTASQSEQVTGRVVRRVLAVFLAIHGFAHLVGTTEAISAIGDDTSVDYILGQWTITSTGLLAGSAALWTAVAVGFAAVGVATWIDTPRWPSALAAVTSVSLILCLVALPQAAIGAVINVVLLATGVTLLNRRLERHT